ncbi:MAG: phosphatidylglycerophosphatase A [Thermodesulfovibrio sp.]|nr:phosphatidylglycerophosphatase A [Thermodesulfovibrio sp.]
MLKLTMVYRIISTLFFIGYFPFAPGTLASALAMITLFIFKPSDITIFLILIVTFVLGIISSDKMEKQTNKKDASYIVIDEFAGYLIAIFLIPFTIQNLLLAFIFFRFFDILKPPPIKQIEKRIKGGLGIMIDDIIAGIMSNILLRILLMLS